MTHETNTPPTCENCKVIHGRVYWRHPELYHTISSDIRAGMNWYGNGTDNDADAWAKAFEADVQPMYTRNFTQKLLCQDCRKPYEEAAARNEKISQKNARLEAAGQLRLPGW